MSKQKLSVLIVDDSAFARMHLRRMLEKVGGVYVIGEAGDGKEALRMVERLRPEVVTLDITMPQMSGIEALERMNDLTVERPVVVMISAMGQKGLIKESVRLGAKDFIIKPINEESLRKVFSRIAGRGCEVAKW